jgi:hypothetical protein
MRKSLNVLNFAKKLNKKWQIKSSNFLKGKYEINRKKVLPNTGENIGDTKYFLIFSV